MRLYKFLPKEYALLAMRERRLKIARLNELNDPFEMLPFAIKGNHGRVAFIQTMEQMNLIAGLLCFSRTWNNPVIWAHYADQHRGICLGFDIPKRYVKKVSYRRKRKPFPDNFLKWSYRRKLNLMKELLFTKFDDWRYEDESRVSIKLDWSTRTENGTFFKEWDHKLKLAQVIVGMRSPACKRELQHALRGYGEPVTLTKATASIKSFAVDACPDDVRNHDDVRYLRLLNDGLWHPLEFVNNL